MMDLPPQGYLEAVGRRRQRLLSLQILAKVKHRKRSTLWGACLAMRENTEPPITVGQGMNVLVGRGRVFIREYVKAILAYLGTCNRAPEWWDGHASEPIGAHASRCFFRRAEPASA